MATIRLRFSGRFVLAEPTANGESLGTLNALALKIGTDDARNSHRALMAVMRASLPEKGPQDLFPPSFSLIGPAKGKSVEHVVWDLSGWNVSTANTKGKFSWGVNSVAKLPDLGALEKARGKSAILQPSHAKANTAQVTSKIQVSAGTGAAPVASAKKFNFTPKNNPRKPVLPRGQTFADYVDITIEASKHRLEMVNRANSKERKVVDIVVRPGDVEAVVRFSNLCPQGSGGVDDPEFTEYYGLFDHDAVAEELLIAKAMPPFGEIGSWCFLMVYATYE